MASSSYYESILNSLTKPTYTSKYQSQIDSLMDSIMNREKFSYDFNADPLYQQYKDQYTKLGNEASMNAVSNAAAMTGGFGNSYGVTAASQANQQYLTQLNNVIPELQSAAYSRYAAEGDRMNTELAQLQDAENAAYSQYRDSVSDYYNDYNLAYSGYQDALSAEAAAAAAAAAANTNDAPKDTPDEKAHAGQALTTEQMNAILETNKKNRGKGPAYDAQVSNATRLKNLYAVK